MPWTAGHQPATSAPPGRLRESRRLRALELPSVYRLWQAPFARRKLAPLLAHNDLGNVGRVLDVACGPGINTQYFTPAREYLGLDVNPDYVAYARRRHSRDFVVADVTRYELGDSSRPDFVLVNSFLHHLDTPAVRALLGHLSELVSLDGHLHAIELVAPGRRPVARLLAAWDRGRYARPLGEWHALLSERFHPVVFEPFTVRVLGAVLWNLVYFKGRPRI